MSTWLQRREDNTWLQQSPKNLDGMNYDYFAKIIFGLAHGVGRLEVSIEFNFEFEL